jgi:tetratricopeptide (TPR) repeat protein
MDCRKSLCVALWLVSGLAGCNLTHPTPVVSNSQTLLPGQIVEVPLKKEADRPKRTPKAETCVAYGNFAAEEANAPEKAPLEVEAQRDIARKAYQQALSIDPNCLSAYRGLTALYVAMKDYKHATATYQDALKRFPKDPSLPYELGMCCARQKDWEPALEYLKKATELDQENRQYNNALGYALARAGRYDESLAVFERLQTEAEAHYNLARMLRHLNQMDPCRQHLQTALQKDPEMKPALDLLAELDAPPREVQQTNFTEEPPH